MVNILDELEWRQDVDQLGRSNGSVTQIKCFDVRHGKSPRHDYEGSRSLPIQ